MEVIDIHAFSNCVSLSDITIPESVTKIEEGAFFNCKSLTSIDIPDNVTYISDSAFENCDSLSAVTIGNAVTSISDWAFYGCKNLTSVTIPGSVTEIGWEALGYYYGSDQYQKVDGFTIIGQKGSAAEAYALENDFTFMEDPSVYQYRVLDDGSAEITGYTGNGGEINIPSVLDGHPVTSIGNYAFRNRPSLITVVIPDSVTSIGSGAFYGCSKMSAVTIPNSVSSIGNYCFYECRKLTDITVESDNPSYCSVDGNLYNKNKTTLIRYAIGKADVSFDIPNTVTAIEDNAVAGGQYLTSVTIPNTVSSIGSDAFLNCYHLTAVTIPGSVSVIKNRAFGYYYTGGYPFPKIVGFTITGKRGSAAEAYALENDFPFMEDLSVYRYRVLDDGSAEITGYIGEGGDIIVPSVIDGHTVTSIRNAFANRQDVITVTFPDTLTNIGVGVCWGCINLREAAIPDSVTNIGNYAFYDCKSLTVAAIPDAVKSIGDGAFGDSGLITVTIPRLVTQINDLAFTDCKKLQSITVDAGNTAYCSVDGNLYNKNKTTLIQYAVGKTATEFTVPDSVTHIYAYAFEYADSLTSVTIPDSVTGIGVEAFNECKQLTAVTIPDSVTDIERHAFGYYYNNGTKKIAGFTIYGEKGSAAESYAGQNGFAFIPDYSDFKYRVISESTAEITGYTGDGGRVYIPSVMDGYTITRIGASAFDRCSGLVSVTIPDSVTEIGWGAFDKCSNLTSVIIPASVTRIDPCAFTGCSSLVRIAVDKNNTAFCSLDGNLYDKNVTILIQYAIGTTKTSFSIPDSVTTIGAHAFEDCNSLTSVTIPDSVTEIDYSAFHRCSSLTSVAIPDSVTDIGESVFSGCTGLISVTIPDAVTSIGVGAFSGCSSLTDVTIPGTITSIPSGAFGGCSSLTAVVIPDSVKSIGMYAFSDCTSLTSVKIGKSVESIDDWAFDGCSSLTSVVIPKSVTFIGDAAFDYCAADTADGFTIYGIRGTAAETYANENGFIFIPIGDLNGDGIVSISDATVLQRFLAEMIELDMTDEKIFRQADMNCDGYVNVKDVTSIQRNVAMFDDF